MKTCTCCKIEKEEADFYKHKRMKDGLSPRCKKCDDQGNRATRNKDLDKARGYRNRWKRDLIERINAWKASQGCECCGESESCCLELHHTDPSQKENHPSLLRTSWDRFMTEAEKCVVVCSNCHKKIHAGVLTV